MSTSPSSSNARYSPVAENINTSRESDSPPLEEINNIRFNPYVTNKNYRRASNSPAMFTKYTKGPPVERKHNSGKQSLGFKVHPSVFTDSFDEPRQPEIKKCYKEVVIDYQYDTMSFENRYYRLSDTSRHILICYNLVEDLVVDTQCLMINDAQMSREIPELNRTMKKFADDLEYNELLSKANLEQYDNSVRIKGTRFFRLLADFFKENKLEHPVLSKIVATPPWTPVVNSDSD